MKITGDNAADKSYNDPDIGGLLWAPAAAMQPGKEQHNAGTARTRHKRRLQIIEAVIQVCWSVLWIADPAAAMNAELENRTEL